MEIPEKIPSPSGRFALRPLSLRDQGDLYRLDSDVRVMEYFPKIRNRPESFEYLLKALKYAEENPGLGKYVLEAAESEDFMGLAVIQHLEESGEIEVGYRLHRRYWGNGLATEAAGMMLDLGFRLLGLPRLVGITHPDNLGSSRVLEKIGMDYSGMGKHYEIEVKCFAIEREKWQKMFG
ncbi:MAG: GNAT family N-acetyltransferase [Bacteroidia bacterium]|nr:GNAT family N-acetyltransferase [Bacteroidia bacterium]